MSAKRLGRGRGEAPAPRLDNNYDTYAAELDGRNAEARIQQVRIDRIDPSPFQIRRVFSEREIEDLADNIRANGLIHEPKARPHPTKLGWYELMPGELRLRALQRLVERGQAESVLRRNPEGHWLIPIKVEDVPDERAEAIVFSENKNRTDLAPWEWALAWQQRRASLAAHGQPSGVRDVAESLGEKFQTVGQYLQAADGLTQEVLLAAGTVSGGQPAHARLAKLSLAALLRVAREAGKGTAAAADRLLLELKNAGDAAAVDQIARRRQARIQRKGLQTFQINIRTALTDLTPQQANHYLQRMTPALEILAERASRELVPEVAESLARALEKSAARLRGR